MNSNITDESLQILVQNFLAENPNAGASFSFCQGFKAAVSQNKVSDVGAGVPYAVINGHCVKLDEVSDCFDIIVGSDMVQVSKIYGQYKITNAMNGWGNNCMKEFENIEIKILYESIPKEDKPIVFDEGMDIWDEAFTEAPFRINPIAENFLKNRFNISRKPEITSTK